MISKIDNKEKNISESIHSIFQESYQIEAELLNCTNFPPLKRESNDIQNCKNIFYAYYVNNKIAGVIEIDSNMRNTHIQSLVVYPKYFRKGIASRLVKFILDSYPKAICFSVETGLANTPAIRLYKSLNFKETTQWDTNHGVRKVRLIRSK